LWLNISPKKQQHVAALLRLAGLDLFPGKVLAPFALCAFVLNIQVWSCSPESGSEFVSFAYFVVDSVFPDLSVFVLFLSRHPVRRSFNEGGSPSATADLSRHSRCGDGGCALCG
jgi:hypothetical protein